VIVKQTIVHMEFTLCLSFTDSFINRFCTVTDFSPAEKDGHEILHACWPTIRTGLLPLSRSKVEVTRDKKCA